jgi:hypothetical protein
MPERESLAGAPLAVHQGQYSIDMLEESLWVTKPIGGLGSRLTLCDWYRIVDAFVGIDSEDIGLRMRFKELGEYLSDSPPARENSRWLHCSVKASDRAPAHVVTFIAPEEVNVIHVTLALFRDRGYIEMQHDSAYWRSIDLAGRTQPLLIAKGARVLVDAREPSQPLIASCAINWAMRMQREILFFHAAAVGIDGDGVLITGAIIDGFGGEWSRFPRRRDSWCATADDGTRVIPTGDIDPSATQR